MYRIHFTDNTIFDGSAPKDSKWGEIPNKPIQKIEYRIGNKIATLENFEKYGHIVGRAFGVNVNCNIIEYVIIMGKINNEVCQAVFDFKKMKLYKKFVEYGTENQGESDTSWINGMETSEQICFYTG